MENFFNSDYDRKKIPGAIIINAGHWYYRNSILFAVGLWTAILLVLGIIMMIVGNVVSPQWFGEGSLISDLFTYSVVILLVIGTLTIVLGNMYAMSRKSVIKKYLRYQIQLTHKARQIVISEKFKENKNYWDSIDIILKRKMITTEFQGLNSEDQYILQDTFLDILNLKKITLNDLPQRLIPIFPERKESHVRMFFDRIFYFENLLKQLD